MATEPLDLLERRRWKGSTKVYTRKNKGQRKSVSNSEGQEGCKETVAVEDGNLQKSDCPAEVDCYRVSREEEGGGCEGPVSSNKKARFVDDKEVVVRSSENGDRETGNEEMEIGRLGQEGGDSRSEAAVRESSEVLLRNEDQLGQAVGNSHRESAGFSGNDGRLGNEDGTTHVETSQGGDGGLRENSGRLGQVESASGEEMVRISDDESPERREVLPPSSGCDIADGNGEVRQNNQLLEMQQLPPVMIRVDDKLRINVSGAKSSNEIRGVKRKLETELDQVRSLFKKLQAKELQVTESNCNMNSGIITAIETINTDNINRAVGTHGDASGNFNNYIQPRYALNDAVERTLTRVGSEVGSVLQNSNKLFNRSLSVSVVDNNHGVGDYFEREKRTPKANQLYRNSEFLLGKDRLPSESNKKVKPNGLASDKNRERAFRSCNTLLQRLMKHNYAWVFNEPVDAMKLGLHDYHDIIKQPMDLGTIKSRLSMKFYRSPTEFADDVRLVFNNAMTYNPKGHDVNFMADSLLNIFEERWSVIETEYNSDWRHPVYQDSGLSTPTSRKFPATQFYTPARIPAPIPAHVQAPVYASVTPAQIPAHVQAPVYASVTPVPQMRSDNSQLMTMNTAPKLKPSHHVGRTPAPKKPKARDLNKRDMTYDEKQKLSTNLQNLPSEKLDALVQIIKKRSSALSQNNDEIEVDIDGVDIETLWELDRFVTNYKKSLSKNKRKAELALQTRPEAVQTTAMTNTAPGTLETQKETRIGENNDPPVEVEKQGDHASRSSSSSSSSSDSGSSSSSDSDSDSSSSGGSDSRRSPGT